MIDSQIGYIADFIPDKIATNGSMALFIGMNVVFAVGGYMLLSHIKRRKKQAEFGAWD
jgi:hypothetical protein